MHLHQTNVSGFFSDDHFSSLPFHPQRDCRANIVAAPSLRNQMTDLDTALEFMDSKALIGFQMDASHLHHVMQILIRNQQQQQQAVQGFSRRMQAIEGAVQDCVSRVSSVSAALAHLDEIAHLRSQVAEVATVVDSVNRQVVPELRRQIDETRRTGAVFERNIQLVSQALQGVQQDQAATKQQVDDTNRDIVALGRQTQSQLQALHDDHIEKDRDRVLLHQRSQETLRELQQRSERIEKDFGARFRDALEELNNRTNENFRQVEVSARSVDSELQKIRTDIGNIRAEFNAMDTNVRSRFGKVTEDVDAKFDLVLSLLQNVEKNSSVLEDALATAGRALAARREMQAFAPASGLAGGAPQQTTTTTSLRGNIITSDVRRNFSNELSGARGASAASNW